MGGSDDGGVIFQLTPAGNIKLLHEFNESTVLDGSRPAGLLLANDGNFYGGTEAGGNYLLGVLYRITTSGNYALLYSFKGFDGSGAMATPMQHTNGKIYGLTTGGGRYGYGVLYCLDLGLSPFIKLMTQHGKAGQKVQILGQGFTGTTSVLFGTGPTTLTVVSDTYMTAKVPSTGTTGAVTVTTPTGTLTSNTTFKVIPTLTSFNPTTGTVGTSVVLTGTALSQTSKVTFGGVKATSFTVNSATNFTAIVPVGARTGNIVVTTPGGTASKGTFTVY
jgi:uncharacterized repeat protein (TIGR03803 family)